eukprot:gene1580-2116_t
MPAVPDVEMDLIHVFDVAKAHLLAMTNPNAAYKRFLLVDTIAQIALKYIGQCKIFEPKNLKNVKA